MSAAEHDPQGDNAGASPRSEPQRAVTRMVHVIPGLAPGGAERLLLAWVEADAERTAHLVLTLRPGGALTAPLEAAGAQVLPLNTPRRLATALAATRRHRPHTVVGWLHHGNAAALAVHALAAPKARLCFSHHGGPHPPPGPWHRRVAQALERAAWHRPHAHLYAARTSARWDAARGRSLRRAWVLPAGIDTEVFSPELAQRALLRQRLGLDQTALLIGLLGRLDPAKDFHTGIRAFFENHKPDRFLVFMGPDMDPLPEQLRRNLSSYECKFVRTLPVENGNVAKVVASLDAVLVSSRSESIPRISLEAMACEVPCIMTAVGDASVLLRTLGWVAEIGDARGLARGLDWALSSETSTRGLLSEARAVIRKEHSKKLLKTIAHYV